MRNSVNGKRMRLYCLAATLSVLSLSAASAADKAGTMTDTGTFRSAFSGSFYGFDVCGQAATGKIYRKALSEKVEHCPFTADAKITFRQWATANEARGTADVQRYIADHDKLPERLDPKKLNCRTEHDSPAYQKITALLEQYAQGKVGAEAVVPDACDAGMR